MDIYSFYITPEEYDLAEKNGISKENLEQRIRVYRWNKRDALTKPLKKRGVIPKKMKELAKQNGISMTAFYSRIHKLKWDMKKAATEPIMSQEEVLKKSIESRTKYPPEWIEIAKKNGISAASFRRRVRECGLSYVEAAMIPLGEAHNV